MFGGQTKTKLQVLRKTVILSALFTSAAAVFGALYSLVAFGNFRPQYSINACFIVGALVIAASLVVLLFPASLKGQGPIDHTNYAELTMKAREKKRALAYEILYVGFGIFIIAGAAELIASTI